MTLRREDRLRRLLAASVETLEESLAVQRETLRHAESIDRKTGPTAPQAPVATR